MKAYLSNPYNYSSMAQHSSQRTNGTSHPIAKGDEANLLYPCTTIATVMATTPPYLTPYILALCCVSYTHPQRGHTVPTTPFARQGLPAS